MRDTTPEGPCINQRNARTFARDGRVGQRRRNIVRYTRLYTSHTPQAKTIKHDSPIDFTRVSFFAKVPQVRRRFAFMLIGPPTDKGSLGDRIGTKLVERRYLAHGRRGARVTRSGSFAEHTHLERGLLAEQVLERLGVALVDVANRGHAVTRYPLAVLR